jgi:RimJ/RimL family protein N-acetyltransferase
VLSKFLRSSIADLNLGTWVESMMKDRMDMVIFAIKDIASGTAIGICQLFNINWRHRSAEMQIRIGDDCYQGKEVGGEAVQLLCQFGYFDLNLHRIYLSVFRDNVSAIAAYEKCLFKQEGLMRQAAFIDGDWTDVLVMGRLSCDE